MTAVLCVNYTVTVMLVRIWTNHVPCHTIHGLDFMWMFLVTKKNYFVMRDNN